MSRYILKITGKRIDTFIMLLVSGESFPPTFILLLNNEKSVKITGEIRVFSLNEVGLNETKP